MSSSGATAIWGAEAAARTYFGMPASALTPQLRRRCWRARSSTRARYSPASPPARLLRRQQIILARMGSVEPPAPPPTASPESDEPVPHEGQEAPAADAVPSADGVGTASRRRSHASGA